jgi:cytochrome c peroxidase
MSRPSRLAVGLSLALALPCCRQAAPTLSAADMVALATLSPPTLPAPPVDVSNRWSDDAAAAALGQRLFFERGFAGRLLDRDNDGSPTTLGKFGETGKVSCAACHIPASGFLDTRSFGQQISLAAGWGLRRAPSLLDVGHRKLLTWDGRRDALYNQVFAPIESPVEMNSSRLYVAEQLAAGYRADYEAVFGPMPPFDDPARFPQLSAALNGCRPKTGFPQAPCDGTMHGMPGDNAEYDSLNAQDQEAVDRAVVNLGKAIAAYQRKLACGPSRFDQFMHGDPAALTEPEQRGAALFVGKGQCIKCHAGPFLSDDQFHNVGLGPKPVGVVFADLGDRGASAGLGLALLDPLNSRGRFSDGDDGRLPDSLTPALEAAFKTPMLRCVDRRPSFMHTGQLRSLALVIDFFNRGGDGPGMFGTNEIAPLGLTDAEQADLVKFLLSLSGPGPEASLLQEPAR